MEQATGPCEDGGCKGKDRLFYFNFYYYIMIIIGSSLEFDVRERGIERNDEHIEMLIFARFMGRFGTEITKYIYGFNSILK